jgi:hypothetical protein
MNAQPAREVHREPNHAEAVVDEVRGKIQVEKRVIDEARERRNLVKDIVEAYHGVLRTYDAGSIAHGTAKKPLPDADCGGVLDRRSYPELGPDGGGEGPNELVARVAEFVMAELRKDYPDAECEITKRAIQISFNEPIDDEDPSVDLIMALTRADEPGLWIPNTEKNGWDASDPEEHTRLLTERPKDLRVHRARLIRLGKVAVEQDGEKKVVISFNIEALALLHVAEGTGLAEGLRDFFLDAADDIEQRLTPDPADVSPPIKLPEGITHAQAAMRLRFFGQRVADAIENRYDEQAVRRALADVFPEQLPDAPRSEKSAFARALRRGNVTPGVQAALGAGAERLKDTRSFGDHAQA